MNENTQTNPPPLYIWLTGEHGPVCLKFMDLMCLETIPEGVRIFLPAKHTVTVRESVAEIQSLVDQRTKEAENYHHERYH